MPQNHTCRLLSTGGHGTVGQTDSPAAEEASVARAASHSGFPEQLAPSLLSVLINLPSFLEFFHKALFFSLSDPQKNTDNLETPE